MEYLSKEELSTVLEKSRPTIDKILAFNEGVIRQRKINDKSNGFCLLDVKEVLLSDDKRKNIEALADQIAEAFTELECKALGVLTYEQIDGETYMTVKAESIFEKKYEEYLEKLKLVL